MFAFLIEKWVQYGLMKQKWKRMQFAPTAHENQSIKNEEMFVLHARFMQKVVHAQ